MSRNYDSYEEKIKLQQDIVSALSRNYLNVYLVDIEKRKTQIVKLEGYVTAGIDRNSADEYDYDTLCNQYAKDRVHPEDVAAFIRAMRLEYVDIMLDEHHEYSYTYRTIEEGEIHFYQFKCLRLSGDNNKIIVGFQNIDSIIEKERKESEALAEALVAAEDANRAKTAFLFNMSHEIRTPMNAIIGYTDIIKKNIDNRDKIEDCIQKMSIAENNLLNLINNVLEMSKIENEQIAIKHEAVDISTTPDKFFALINDEAWKKNISITYDMDIYHPFLYMDEMHFVEIVVNIIGNSIKYTNSGGSIYFSIKQIPREIESECYIVFTCSDNGIGISDEFLPKIYDKFEREVNSTISGVCGGGLGLGIVKKIIEYMGGTIECASERGVGTTFTVKIPHSLAEEGEITGDKVEHQSYKDIIGRRILLVEDNAINAEVAKEILEDQGLLVEIADNGKNACDLLEEKGPGYFDIVLMDIQMPVMDGYEATKKIRRFSDKTLARIPIIALTANAFDEDIKNSKVAGMNAHISKPIDIYMLMDIMKRVLR